jgi:lipoprotein LprG
MPSQLWNRRAAPTARRRHDAGASVGAGLAVVALLVAGCSGTKAADPTAVAREAKTTVRIQLTSKGAPTTLRTANGEIKRPDGFVGTIGATVLGLQVDVPVVSLGGHFLAKLPLSPSYSAIDPTTLGFSDPAILLNPTTGLSTFLTDATDLVAGKSTRVGGEVAETISGKLKAAQVTPLLPLKGSAPVSVTFDVIPKSNQLRQISLTGNFATATASTTYTLTFDDYGAPVTITLPTT